MIVVPLVPRIATLSTTITTTLISPTTTVTQGIAVMLEAMVQ